MSTLRSKIEGSGGNLVLHNNAARTAIFLAGGITAKW
jgi:hypothetical protein